MENLATAEYDFLTSCVKFYREAFKPRLVKSNNNCFKKCTIFSIRYACFRENMKNTSKEQFTLRENKNNRNSSSNAYTFIFIFNAYQYIVRICICICIWMAMYICIYHRQMAHKRA